MSQSSAHTAVGIVVYGSDELLLQTRAMVLEKAGYAVYSTLECDEMEELVRRENVALLVLCHSLSPAKCERALAYVESKSPATRSLVLTAGLSICADHARDSTLSALDGPRKLTDTVREMLDGEK